ncbi:hypothetical protein FHG89_13150 [Micromonospora orduensis]|uniref:Uncharacterized protein n=1 Tax=Micromonospora orduensis TaxID=1420891 RepID=A0A5C4QUG2_9ACTN|nr:hypothetical protein [Micromonospora orduensis]TNH29287.1 hypothetical protein FHG89_13150 [Micromonospora orduensis]
MSGSPTDPLLTSVQDAVVQAYYPDRVRAAAGARTRAQAAQSVVTVFAGALVATFTLTSLATAAPVTRVGGCAAVTLWLLAAVLYVRAIATIVPAAPTAAREARDGRSLVEEVLKRGDDEARQVDRRQRTANLASVLALAVTMLTFGSALFVEHPDKARRGVLILGTEGQATLRALCGTGEARVDGEIDVTSFSGQFVSVRLDRCGERRDVTVRIPRSAVSSALTMEG